MKAAICTKYGPPEVLKLQEVERPVPKSNEVLIKIHAAAVTISDCIVRSGKVSLLFWLPMRLFVGFRRPRNPILGFDLSGEIEEVGKDIKRFKKGDPVFAFAGMHCGAFAEYVCLPEDGKRMPADSLIALKPAKLSYEEAAALPSRGTLALHFLRKGNIRKSQKVLIYGASGGAGTFAVQIAKSLGADVTGVCSTANLELIKSLGADKVIDYTREDFTQRGENYDLIFDAVGKRYSSKLQYKKALAPGGKFISIDDTPQIGLEDFIMLKDLVEASGFEQVEFSNVYEIKKEGKSYPLFLMTARKSQ